MEYKDQEYVGRSSYLSGGDELQRPQRASHVWNVRLQIVESRSNAGLNLRWRRP
jgi:hypothetical protein